MRWAQERNTGAEGVVFVRCKRCGSENLQARGDWLLCPRCGAQMAASRVTDSERPVKKGNLMDWEDSAKCARGT